MNIRTLFCSVAVGATLMLGIAPAIAATPSSNTAAAPTTTTAKVSHRTHKASHRTHKARTAAAMPAASASTTTGSTKN